MLFDSLFKSDKQITIGRARKRKLTVKDVVERLDRVELSNANCTLIRDHRGNEKIEDYGQVDIYRLRDEVVFVHENGFFITTPTGMKLKTAEGGANLAAIVSEEPGLHDEPGPEENPDVVDDREEESEESEEDQEDEADEADEEPDPDAVEGKGAGASRESRDAFSETARSRGERAEEAEEQALGVGQVIRLRFFYSRIPYEIDCQIVDRFNPTRFRHLDLTPRFGVGYHVRPVSDVRKRDKRRYIRYTHKIGFGHLRIRNEIQFQVYALKTDLEIPEKGALEQSLSADDYQTFPYGTKEVSEVKGADKLEDIVEFFMACMVNNPPERRQGYLSKPYLDRLNRPSLVGLGRYSVVGAQQATVLPKIFVKQQGKGRSELERQLASRGGGQRDSRKMRQLEEIHERFQLLTRERKIWQKKKWRQPLAGDYDNDRALMGFSSSHGLPSGEVNTVRQMMLPVEVTDIGVENITLRPIPFEDARARDLDYREFVRQEDGIQVDLLNFSVGGAEIRGGESQDKDEALLKYLIGENYESMTLAARIEALQRTAVRLHLYPVLTFLRSDIQEYEPSLPFMIPVIARVARFRVGRTKEDQEPRITSLGVEFIYNPAPDSYSRDVNDYDQWEQVSPYTESANFIGVHKCLQLLFGVDKAKEDSLREDRGPKEEKAGEGEEEAEAVEES